MDGGGDCGCASAGTWWFALAKLEHSRSDYPTYDGGSGSDHDDRPSSYDFYDDP